MAQMPVVKVEVQHVEERLIHWRTMAQSWLHSRKALLLVVTFGIASVALFVGKLNGDQWITLVKWAVPSYLAANVADGAVQAYKGGDSKDS